MPKKAKKIEDRGGKLYIGTSGWMYKDWGENFYPKTLDPKKYLNYHSKHFNTVEVNSSFYRLPYKKTFENWAKQVEDRYVITSKFSKYATHILRLQNPKEAIFMFLENASGLGEKMGPILVQIPPSFRADIDLLDNFFKEAKVAQKTLKIKRIKWAFEPRHKTWFEEENIKKLSKVLKKNKAAMVFAHSSRYPYFDIDKVKPTADFVYLRFHGPKELFSSPYMAKGLRPWVPKIEGWLKEGLTVYAYFNNDRYGFALKDAKVLQKYLK